MKSEQVPGSEAVREEKNQKKKVVIGMSGGVDSSVAACPESGLAAEDPVLCYELPVRIQKQGNGLFCGGISSRKNA